ncbi:hypothetical protein [Bosea sp. PAMC 26642]|uniref:hypothetical protein n=1 Tax=Bosea sp. (strain PAMC 26642) TaxID=1792307 RepID=UPI0012E82BBC|nr:hypothetical protein [Bosea sp. PAMC 26642]
MLRRAALLSILILPVHQAVALDCRLDHATYRESVSGAVLAFQPKDSARDAGMSVGPFQMRLPNISETFEGDIAWNAGSHARPAGEMGHACLRDESADASACRLWAGSAYGLGDAGAGLLDDADMSAPKAILLVDFGRSLATTRVLASANPGTAAFDVFTLSECRQ